MTWIDRIDEKFLLPDSTLKLYSEYMTRNFVKYLPTVMLNRVLLIKAPHKKKKQKKTQKLIFTKGQ